MGRLALGNSPPRHEDHKENVPRSGSSWYLPASTSVTKSVNHASSDGARVSDFSPIQKANTGAVFFERSSAIKLPPSSSRKGSHALFQPYSPPLSSKSALAAAIFSA